MKDDREKIAEPEETGRASEEDIIGADDEEFDDTEDVDEDDEDIEDE